MRLSRFAVRGFQSYDARQDVRLEPDLTLLAGRNNVGKSALLRALRFPVAPEAGSTPDLVLEYEWTVDRQDLVLLVPPEMHAQFADVFAHVAMHGPTELGVTFAQRNTSPAVGAVSQPQPTTKDFNQLEIREIRLGDLVRLQIFTRSEESPPALYLATADATFNQTYPHVAQGIQVVVSRALNAQFVISPRRSSERMAFTPTTTLTSDGANLTTVVATLFTNDRHGLFHQLEDFMKDVFPEIRFLEVKMEESPPKAEIFLALARREGLSVPLRHSGTGIEQALMLATAVLTTPGGYLFLVDEPHAFLHPYAEHRVLRFIRSHGEHQYIVATHSPAFLTSYKVNHARLVTIEEDGTHVADAGAHAAILDELGITAADLWSSAAILWGEGSSDVAVAQVVTSILSPDAAVTFRAMPEAMRTAARGKRHAGPAIELSRAIAEAVTPAETRMVFLFDADERSEQIKADVVEVTNGRARFLPTRELENLLLSAPAIHDDLVSLCKLHDLPEPTADEVSKYLLELTETRDDPALYPAGTAEPDVTRIVGSEVLRRLYSKWAKTEYDKVSDGSRLARLVAVHDPERFQPLQDIIRELEAETRA